MVSPLTEQLGEACHGVRDDLREMTLRTRVKDLVHCHQLI